MSNFGDVLWGLGEAAVNDLGKNAKKISKDKRLSDEQRESYKDLMAELDQRKQSIKDHDIMGAIGRPNYCDDEDYEEEDENYIEDDNNDSEEDTVNINIIDNYTPFPISEITDINERNLRFTAENGDDKSQYELGLLYLKNTYNLKYTREAVYWLKRAAQKGNLNALYSLGLLCECDGAGDKYMASQWYYMAAIKGHPDSQYKMGLLLKESENDNEDRSLVLKYKGYVSWFQDAANQRHTGAAFQLGYSYSYGEGIEKDLDAALNWWKIAADLGDPDAMAYMGVKYRDGKEVKQDTEKGMKYIRISAEMGSSTGQIVYAYCFAKGMYVEQNYKKALMWYEKAAKQNNYLAFEQIGVMYRHGYGVEKDLNKAAYYYYESLKHGGHYAENALMKLADMDVGDALSYMGNAVLNGLIEEYEGEERLIYSCYKGAAVNGSARGECNLGYCYEMGIHMRKNSQKAVEWYRKAADHGLPVGKFRLALMYEKGEGVFKDNKMYLSLLSSSANEGCELAQNRLGMNYKKGIGVDINYAAAFEWFQKAANNGLKEAQYNLGVMYELGQGVDKDLNMAFGWYKKAALQGLQEAKKKFYEYLQEVFKAV